MSRQNYNILIADDDASVRESLCKLLVGEGYQVTAVANGAEVVAAFFRDQNQIDLLLIDLNMPLKNGWATLDRLLEMNPALPILIVTGQPNQYEMAEAAGVCALVEKPIDVPLLLQVIRELLTRSISSRRPNQDPLGLPFHFVSAAGYVSRYLWKEHTARPYSHWGLNE